MAWRSDSFLNVPGYGDVAETFENDFFWGRDWEKVIVPGQVSGAARDAGSTPTNVLRPGLLLGLISATGLLKEYSATATDGTDVVFGVLMHGLRMVDLDGNNQNKYGPIMVGGLVKGAKLIGLDENARATMQGRFIFDDRLFVPNIYDYQRVVAKTADYTVVNGTDNNVLFTNAGAAGAVVFTLPTTILKGQKWRFFAEADQALTVAAAAGKLVTFNNPAATSVALSTAGEIVGGSIEVTVNASGTKYIAILNVNETQTPVVA